MKAEYFQAVEQTFLECTGRGLSMSETDRSQIEDWFESGIPLQIVQSAVIGSCTDREKKVRTIGIARKAVEKEFSAWQQRRLGAHGAELGSSKSEAENNTLLDRLTALHDQSEILAFKTILADTTRQLKALEGEQKQRLVLDIENQMYERLWLGLSEGEQYRLSVQLDAIVDGEKFLNASLAESYRITHRHKLLREKFGLVPFDQFC